MKLIYYCDFKRKKQENKSKLLVVSICKCVVSSCTGRSQAGVTKCEGVLYAVGGCDSWNCLNSAEVSVLHSWRTAEFPSVGFAMA